MKAPAFEYIKPRSLDQVFSVLAEYGDEARLLAGGQTLMATLNMRLSEPAIVVDITAIEALRGIGLTGDGRALRIGALATHSQIEASALVAQHAPLLTMAAPHIAHRAIRNLGTWGGSIAYADPAAEWPACALALDAIVVVRGAAGERRIAAGDFFLDLYTTALMEGELVIACELPLANVDHCFGFDELARRHGDYAIVGLAVATRFTGRMMQDTRVCFLGIGTTPIRARETERFFEGRRPDTVVLQDAACVLAGELVGDLAPVADLTNAIATKRHLATVLLKRVVAGLSPSFRS